MVVSSLLCPMRIGERASGRSGQIYLVGHGLQPLGRRSSCRLPSRCSSWRWHTSRGARCEAAELGHTSALSWEYSGTITWRALAGLGVRAAGAYGRLRPWLRGGRLRGQAAPGAFGHRDRAAGACGHWRSRVGRLRALAFARRALAGIGPWVFVHSEAVKRFWSSLRQPDSHVYLHSLPWNARKTFAASKRSKSEV